MPKINATVEFLSVLGKRLDQTKYRRRVEARFSDFILHTTLDLIKLEMKSFLQKMPDKAYQDARDLKDMSDAYQSKNNVVAFKESAILADAYRLAASQLQKFIKDYDSTHK